MLEIENLRLAIHDQPILHGISLDVAPGQIVGLIGESGSGKSMTAYAITGLAPSGARAQGRIGFLGRDLLHASEEEMCDIRGNEISMIFQEPMTALNPVQTVGDQVAETIRIHTRTSRGEARRIARETLDRVGLPPERVPLSRYPHELSGGQRQRVCIAMAIALRPRLLVADEPTTALDVTTQAGILELLARLVREDDMGLLLITHDLAVVHGLADHIHIMQAGRIVEHGPTEALFANLRHPYSRALLAASAHAPQRAPHADHAPLLECRGVVREYALPRPHPFAPAPRLRAVDGVSFTLERGESLGVVGGSGCGKSTLARAVLGLEEVQGGEILLDGAPVFDGRRPVRAQRRKMQAVFQDPYGSFNPRHRVGRIVAEPFHLFDKPLAASEREARVAEALREVGLSPDDARKYPHEFSGGQRQRIAIARALVIRPELIVLDEAVSALDVSIRARILDLLAELGARHGLAYLFISHDLSVVRAITDRVLVMDAGRIVEEGPTEAVLAAPSHPVTRALVAAAPRLPPEIVARAAGQGAHPAAPGS